MREAWGSGRRFGIVPIENDQVYWFACASYQKNATKEFKEVDLRELFSNFNPLVAQLIKATPSDQIIEAGLHLGFIFRCEVWVR